MNANKFCSCPLVIDKELNNRKVQLSPLTIETYVFTLDLQKKGHFL